ncbi:Ger(x)C family spore germination protein [Salicibibacter cibarius]|uniref:Ger(X)C family spore germination protein n=1 Tax=Salicibibacter cibarius TaxID=2743000 RepID=A0A7T6Z1Y2_9BACI|nr:Ger(x)C family spore germination protein [Salicibibacter cibarius]QQK75493.1 Ger(x)C family spore germination protein [Salicibibacter cibarius]
MKKIAMICLCLSLLMPTAGCWSGSDLDEVAMVFGGGLDKTENGYELSVEILQSSGEITAAESDHEGMVLSMERETLFDAVRSMIRQEKRRLIFTHTNILVLGESLAVDDLTTPIDVLKRDQMPRLNSLLLITPDDPKDILETATISGDLTSVEMADSMEGTEFTGEFKPMDLKTVFEMLNSPISATFVPMLQINNENKKTIAELSGTAVINEDQMVGTLNVPETKGLLYLRNEAERGSITAKLTSGDKVSMEVQDKGVIIDPSLNGDQLTVDIEMEIWGTLAEVPSDMIVNDQTIQEMEDALTEEIRTHMQMTLKKLQKELKTDILDFGILVHQKYPQKWPDLTDQWDDIFANADVNLMIETSIDHEGLLDQDEGEEKSESIPFFFWNHKD